MRTRVRDNLNRVYARCDSNNISNNANRGGVRGFYHRRTS